MTPKRAYYVSLSGLALLSIAVLAAAYGTNSLLAQKATQLVSLKAQQAGLTNQQTQLQHAKKDIATYTPLYTISQSVVPENKDQTQTVRQIANLAAANNISIGSITFPSSTIGATSAATPAAATATPPPTVNANSATVQLSQLLPAPGIPGVYELPITVSSSTDPAHMATYNQLISFLSALEKNRQTALVSGLNIAPTAGSDKLSFTLTLAIYVKPGK